MLEIADQYGTLAEFAEAQELRPAAPEPDASRYLSIPKKSVLLAGQATARQLRFV